MNHDAPHDNRVATSDLQAVPETGPRLLVGEVLETLAAFRPLPETLEAIAAAVCRHLGFHSCAILLERADSDLLIIEGAAGLTPDYVDAVNRSFRIHIQDPRLNEGPSSRAFLTGQPVIVEDTEADPHFDRWRWLARQHGIRSLISVPLRAQSKTIGALNGYQQVPRRYAAEEVQALMTAATQAGIAIEIARMVELQQETIERLEELTDTLDEQRRVLERSAQIHNALTQLVLTNQGIDAIAATLARVVGCPVIIQDQFLKVLSSAHPNGGAAPELTPLTRDMLEPRGIRPGARDARAPFELPANADGGLKSPRAVAPIVAGRDLLGYVSLVLQRPHATPLSLRALEHAATVLALEIVKDRLAHQIELRVRHGFGDDLVAGRFEDTELMRDRARHLGYDLQGPFQVLVFDIDRFRHYVAASRLPEPTIDTLRQRFTDTLRGVAQHHAPHALLAGRHDHQILILAAVDGARAEAAEQAITAVQTAMRLALPELSVSVGVGRVVPGIDDIPRSYREAEQALQLIRRFGGRDKVTHFRDLGAARLLFQVDDPSELIDFARQRLGDVLVYDQQHDGILMEAIEAYLRSEQSVPRAAERLGLHPNTLRYRLRRAEELLGGPLSDVALLLDVQLASLVLRLIDLDDLGIPTV